jgi:hypothetical protein
MTGIPTAAEIEAAKAALQANLPPEAKKEEGGSTAGDVVSGVLDIAGNVTIEAVGDVVGAVVGTVAEGVGTVAGAAVEGAAAVIGGIFEGLG